MPASIRPRQERYTTAIAIPRDQARHIAKRADSMGISTADYIRILIARDMGITLDGPAGDKA